MNEPMSPKEPREFPEPAAEPTEPVQGTGTDLRRRMEDLGDVVQERAREIGDTVTVRTREAMGEVRYFSEQARQEAAARLERAGQYVSTQTSELAENTRETIRRYPGPAVGLAALAGFLLAFFARRLATTLGRRW